jgi:putative protease
MTERTNTTKPELLAPAGGPEQLREAIHFGADAVYLAGKRWGMRAAADNFFPEELERAVSYAHAHNVQIHLTLNTLMSDEDIAELPGYLRWIQSIGVDAIIVADLGVMRLWKKYAPQVELHVSTQDSVMNAEAARAYAALGASRIVVARELSIEAIKRMKAALPPTLILETFVHGSMCMAYSGRCLLSAALVGPERSANRGACTQPCRWNWRIAEGDDPQRVLPVEEEGGRSYVLSASDLCMLDHLKELQDAGIDSFKIEGRNKGAYYVGCVTNAYRHVLDGEDPELWRSELDKVSHRPYSTGFYFGQPKQVGAFERGEDYIRDRLFIGSITKTYADDGGNRWTEFVSRNKADMTEPLVVLSPHHPIRAISLTDLEQWDEKTQGWVPCVAVHATSARYRFTSELSLETLDMLAQDVE